MYKYILSFLLFFILSISQKTEAGSNKTLSLIRVDLPVASNWPWGGETILCSKTQQKIGSITSLGYDAIDSNAVHVLSVLDQSKCENGTDVIVKVGTDEYKGYVMRVL